MEIIVLIAMIYFSWLMLKYIAKQMTNVALFIISLGVTLLFGLQVAVGYLISLVSHKLKARLITIISVPILILATTLYLKNQGLVSGMPSNWMWWLFNIAWFFYATSIIAHITGTIQKFKKLGFDQEAIGPNYYIIHFSLVSIILAGYFIGDIIDTKPGSFLSGALITYEAFSYVIAIVGFIYILSLDFSVTSLFDNAEETLSKHKLINKLDFSEKFDAELVFNNDIEIFPDLDGVLIISLIMKSSARELVLGDNTYIIENCFFNDQLSKLLDFIGANIATPVNDITKKIGNDFDIPYKDCDDFILRYLDMGEVHSFEHQKKYVLYKNYANISICSCCGLTEINTDESSGDWYCSDICRETDKVCLTISKSNQNKSSSKNITSSLIVRDAALNWDSNHKMLADGGQGGGFAAEKGNTLIDIYSGKDAKIIGDDNAKNGADRLVNSQSIQTKYYKTGARSVGAGFDGQGGSYKYLNKDGTPMPLEVPKDQYDDALRTMANKIEKGKVPGITNPNDAEKLVVRGNLTYSQAQNITKFGTIDSLTYDVSEGMISSSHVAGISILISVVINFKNKGEITESIKGALIQGGSVFSKSMLVHITTQQLHRLSHVQNAIKIIDINNLSTSTKSFLAKGFGLKNASQLNKALRGSAVASVALITITTLPDIIRISRGRMSKAQFIKNISVTSSSIVCGGLGSWVGGALLSPLGPVGVGVGIVAGGALASYVASSLIHEASKNYMIEDKEIVMDVVRGQINYQVTTFMLTEKEIDILYEKLDLVLKNEVIELIFASSNRRATSNMYIKPLVVSIINERSAVFFGEKEIVAALNFTSMD